LITGLGRPRVRIVICGVTGSGKTTLGRRLARDLGIRHIELDGIFHGPNWTRTPPDEFRARVQQAVDDSPNGWVADGNYGGSGVRSLLLSQADTAIWLHLPWRVTYWSMLKRTVRRYVRQEELWNGNRETLRNHFADRDSLLLWGITQHRRSERNAHAALYDTRHDAEIFEVRSRSSLDGLVERFVREAATARESAWQNPA
jgi:adenylate kinase family enzyme